MNKRFIVQTIVLLGVFAGLAHAQMDPEAEKIRKLVVKIQKQMKEIDQLLLRSDRPAEAASKIDETIKNLQDLLKSTEAKQSDVIKGIEELVRLAKYQKSQQSSSGQNRPKPEDEKNQDEEQRRPKSPEQEELQRQQQQQQQQSESNPQDQPEQETGGEQKQATQPPPRGEKAQFQRPSLSDRWGVLPMKEQEDLINAMSSRIPERYRRWIEEYYRRVSRTKR